MIIQLDNPNHPVATVNAIALTNTDRLILLIMRDQALDTKLLDVYVAVDYEDSDLANVDGVALLNDYFGNLLKPKIG